MNTNTQQAVTTAAPWSTTHPTSSGDQTAMTAIRAIAEPHKGALRGTAARGPFDAIMSGVIAPSGVTFAADTVGDVPGWWCRLEDARTGEAILHLHGGWFNWGSAQAYRNLVGHLAARTGVEAFVPDYRLAPEHPFPAATEDVRACYLGIVERGFSKVAITGDSAGGNLALGLLPFATALRASGGVAPVAAVAFSPVTDLALTGASWETRAAVDPIFLRAQAVELVRSYLGSPHADPAPAALTNPMASPLYGELAGLPPIRIHVGDDEMLLDDSIRYVERAVAAGVDAHVDVWEGMAHGFHSAIGVLDACALALDAIGGFLADRFEGILKITGPTRQTKKRQWPERAPSWGGAAEPVGGSAAPSDAIFLGHIFVATNVRATNQIIKAHQIC